MFRIIVFVTLIVSAFGNPIPVFSTGVNDDGTVGPPFFPDIHWTANGHQTISLGVTDFGWFGAPNGCQWTSVAGENYEGYQMDTYATTFDLTGLDPNSAQLSGVLGGDDLVYTGFLNGNQFGVSGNYNSPGSFQVSSGFVAGINTLQFQVYNQGGPTGFLALITGTANSLVQTPQQICNNANTNDWTYGQGYYCVNQNSFVQCYGDPVQIAIQNCASGTSCVCSSQSQECSNHGTSSPCQ